MYYLVEIEDLALEKQVSVMNEQEFFRLVLMVGDIDKDMHIVKIEKLENYRSVEDLLNDIRTTTIAYKKKKRLTKNVKGRKKK